MHPLFQRPLTRDDLVSARRGLALSAAADAAERAAIAAEHDLEAVETLAYQARIEPFRGDGWRLEGRVTARLVQRCVVTLGPVAAEIDEPFQRLWTPDADGADPSGDVFAQASAGRVDLIDAFEGVMDAAARSDPDKAQKTAQGAGEDTAPEIERTPDPIDPAAAALEAFTLALDPYPRAPGATFEGAAFGPPGAAALTDEAARPFAGLETLRAQLAAAERGDAASDQGEDETPPGEP